MADADGPNKKNFHRAVSDPKFTPKLYNIPANAPRGLGKLTAIKWFQVARLVLYVSAPLVAWRISEELRTASFAPQLIEYFGWLIPIEKQMEYTITPPEKQQILFERTQERLAAADDGTYLTGDPEAAQRKIFWSDIMLKKK
mmetsp:Transcript_12969/g.14362  ORF Transcript_12969/g.14362 Transcript_12969/m.14362 type:complete len:142 (-) Transcript_12969:1228-1653(-)